MSDSKNDIAWNSFFNKYNIIEDIKAYNRVFVNANDLKEFREPRLMAKFDHKSQLPDLFLENDISILPVSRGTYILGNMDIFHDFNQDGEIEITRINFPHHLESLDYNNITSESAAINCAFASGILQDFIGETELTPTVSGRMGSAIFEFTISSKLTSFSINVENAQLEIDGGYESPSSLSLIEAKNYLSNDFVIRQLYYPFRLWAAKISKKVKTIFLTYTNGVFHLREYLFVDSKHYNSLKLVQQKKYAFKGDIINVETIQKILSQSKIIQEPRIAFPQANSFERVINLCELLKDKTIISKEYITGNYDFDERQTNYYSDAARYLGLADKKKESGQVLFFLTPKGNNIFNLPVGDRQIEFIKLILSHLVFKKVLELYFTKSEIPSKDEIVEIMQHSGLYNVTSGSTFYRRASTILAWIDWVMDLIQDS